MFTGIIETMGTILDIREEGTNRTFVIQSDLSPHLKTDQSVSHNGVCLTVEKSDATTHQVTAIEETLKNKGTNTNSTCQQMAAFIFSMLGSSIGSKTTVI